MAGPSAATATVCANAYAPIGAAPVEALEGATLCLVNEQRLDAGLRPLVRQPDLSVAAQRHAWDMQGRGYFAHVAPDGDGLFERIQRRAYLRGWEEWSLGENLGWGQRGQSSPAATVLRWLLSAEHRANMLDPEFTDAGVAVTPGAPPPEYTDEGAAAYVLNLGVRSGRVHKRSAVRRSRARRADRKRRLRLPDPASATPPKKAVKLDKGG